MKISGKKKHYIQSAVKVATSSTYKRLKHGAVLVKGGKIINASCNKNKFCSFAQRFRNLNLGNATLHAELGTILGLDRSVTQGSTIYVVRINGTGQLRMSKPCRMCQATLKHCGVSKVFYSTNESNLKCLKL
jgi:deoxycytidylate deaminase